MSNREPLTVYSRVSESGSVAVTGSPTLVPPGEFSSTLRVAVSESKAGASFRSVTLTVTSMVL